MKIEVGEDREIVLKKVFNSIVLESEDGEQFVICMRDTGFEFRYAGRCYHAKEGELFEEKIKDSLKDLIEEHGGLTSDRPYNQIDHTHCWNEESPPCGQKIEHLKCCLCELPNPKYRELVEE